MSEKENKHNTEYDPIVAGREKVDAIHEMYANDEHSSEALLELIQQQNRKELDEKGVTNRLEQSLTDEFWFDPEAKVYVAQQNSSETLQRRLIQIVLEQDFDGKVVKTTKTIGEEWNGVILPDEPFNGVDLEVAKRQLDGLRQMQDEGMIALDDSLSRVPAVSKVIEHGF